MFSKRSAGRNTGERSAKRKPSGGILGDTHVPTVETLCQEVASSLASVSVLELFELLLHGVRDDSTGWVEFLWGEPHATIGPQTIDGAVIEILERTT